MNDEQRDEIYRILRQVARALTSEYDAMKQIEAIWPKGTGGQDVK